jgi:hypothetical protein
MSDFLRVLLLVTRRLELAQIPYMLTGAVALNAWAEPRMTRDIDIVIDPESRSADALLQLFADDFYVAEAHVEEALRSRRMFNVIHEAQAVKVDLIVVKEDAYAREALRRRQPIAIEEQTIFVASPEDVLLSKLQWARAAGESEKQMRDVRSLVAHQPSLDWEYLERSARVLGLEGALQNVRGRGQGYLP